MRKFNPVAVMSLFLLLVGWGTGASFAQEETVAVSASGFGGTREKALDQAAFHAVIRVVENKFSAQKAYGALRNDIRQFVQDNLSLFVDDLSEAKIINKYRRNKLTARIPVKAADVIEAVKAEFPDLAQ